MPTGHAGGAFNEGFDALAFDGPVLIPMPTMSASGTFERVVSGIAIVPMQTISASGTFSAPEFTATASATIPMQTITAAGSFSPTFRGIASATIPMQTLAGTGLSSGASVNIAIASATIPMPVMSAASTFSAHSFSPLKRRAPLQSSSLRRRTCRDPSVV